MKLQILIAACVAGSTLFAGNVNALSSGIGVDKRAVVQQAANAQVPFIQNQGQVNKKVNFYAKLFSGTLFVTRDNALVYSLVGNTNKVDDAASTSELIRSVVVVPELELDLAMAVRV